MHNLVGFPLSYAKLCWFQCTSYAGLDSLLRGRWVRVAVRAAGRAYKPKLLWKASSWHSRSQYLTSVQHDSQDEPIIPPGGQIYCEPMLPAHCHRTILVTPHKQPQCVPRHSKRRPSLPAMQGYIAFTRRRRHWLTVICKVHTLLLRC